MTPEQLRQWCREYDAICGHYPEHEWEGWAFWHYVERRLAGASAHDAVAVIFGHGHVIPAEWWLTDAEAEAVGLDPLDGGRF